MKTLALAGLSVRLMAQAAVADGHDVVALDLFGDSDTRAAASSWACLGEPHRLQIDGQRLLSALARLAQRRSVAGWVAGSGFEGRTALLARGAELLPLIGTAPAAVVRQRDPAQFFAFLDANGIEHPQVRLSPRAEGEGWLLKDLHGSGGWHIRRVAQGQPVALAPGQYLQRECAGRSMSATFVAAGSALRLLGVNQQTVRTLGAAPHVFCGVVGPVPVAGRVLQRLQTVLHRLVQGLALRGLASLDFLLDGECVRVLEVNARPPASLALYPQWQPMAAHVRACLHGELPATPPVDAAVRGHEIVFAPQPLWLDAAAAAALAARPHVHDLPAAQHFTADSPLCSISARGRSAAEVLARLQARRVALLRALETPAWA